MESPYSLCDGIEGESVIQADVIVPIYRDTAMTVRCLESVLAHGGRELRSLIAVVDVSPEPDMRDALEQLARSDVRMRVIHNEQNLGFVATCNRGLAERQGDAVLLNSDTLLTPGWLRELAAVVHADAHTACASPLSNNATFFSVPEFAEETPADRVDLEVVNAACANLPRFTEMPTAHGFCLYMKGRALDLIGHLDPIFSPGYEEENDWVMRAQAMGLVAKRANHAFVYHLGSQSFRKDRLELQKRNSLILLERHPHYGGQVERSFYSLDARVPAHAVRFASSGKLRVALDLRHVSPGRADSASYAIGLARGLAALPEVELTLIVRAARQAADIPGRLVFDETPILDVDIIHKPAWIADPADLGLLFRTPAHVVITHLDQDAYRAPAVFPNQDIANRFRASTALAVSAAQMIIAPSDVARREIIAEFGLAPEEVAVTPLGFEPDELDPAAACDRLRSQNAQFQRGRAQEAEAHWEQTARLTVAAYRAAILRPSERSLRARRLFHDAILSWSAGGYLLHVAAGPSIRNAWKDLNRAVHWRMRRQLGRFGLNRGRRSA